MQAQLLRLFAPNSLHLLYHPVDTGNPGHDMIEHIANNSHRRIDLESTQLVGDRVIGRVEADLGPADDGEQHYKILTVPYAEKKLGNNADAVELVRVIKEVVSAGVETDPRSLQIWASYAYGEISSRIGTVMRNNPTLVQQAKTSSDHAELLAQAKATVIQEVLTEIALMAMELTAITTTNENRLLEEPDVTEFMTPPRGEEMTFDERRDLFEIRFAQAFNTHESSDPFTAELRSICSKISRAHSSGVVYDEDAKFDSYISDLAESGVAEDSLELLVESHDRVTEQYTEGGVVSLHMSDGERFVVDGTLDDDIDETYLPQEVTTLPQEVQNLFTHGDDMETIDKYIELRLNQVYGDPSDKANRVVRTARATSARLLPTRRRADGTCTEIRARNFYKDSNGFHHRPMAPTGTRIGPVNYTFNVSTYPNREERQYVREVVDKILENMRRDFILRSQNSSSEFRAFYAAITTADDTRALVNTIQRAYQARLKKTISIKMFTALNTTYEIKRAELESTPLRISRTIKNQQRTFIPAIPVMKLARTIPTRNLRVLASTIHQLASQDRERVRQLIMQERPQLYARIFSGLIDIVSTASQGKLMYLRFAFYEDRNTGLPNEAHNMIHLLTSQDKAEAWAQLKTHSGIAEPAAA